MSLLTRREVILAKIEVTYNVDPVPVEGTDAVLVEEPSWANEAARMIERPAIRASLGVLQHVYGGSMRTISFTVEVKGSGTADVPPEFGPLLRACGLGETIAATISVTYAPVSTALESITIYYFQDGVLLKLTGARGVVTGTFATGQIGKLAFTFTGHIVAESDVALPSPTYVATVPPPVINTPFALGAFSAIVESLAFDMGNQIGAVPDMSAVDGFGEVRITGRDVVGSFNPEATLIATHNFFSEWNAGTVQALTSGLITRAAGNQYKIDLPAVSSREIAPGDRDAVRTFEVNFGAAEVSGDDEISIVFT